MSQLNEKQAFSALAITREFVPPAAIQCQLSTQGELLSRELVLSVASLGCSAGVGQCRSARASGGGLGTAASSALRSLWAVELCGLSSPGSRFSGRRCGQRGWVLVRAAEEPR
ncbi:hypothetical protein AOLI_G00121460 [Acnodon oligacanthus]